jgi:predicted  nucleic acid-binding Zn-ribbon protein
VKKFFQVLFDTTEIKKLKWEAQYWRHEAEHWRHETKHWRSKYENAKKYIDEMHEEIHSYE